MDKFNEKNIEWYVLFAANGKIRKVKTYLDAYKVETFFPMYYAERKIPNQNRTKQILNPVITNLLFVRSSKKALDPLLKEIKIDLNHTSDFYYRDKGTKKIIIVPDEQMQNFIKVAGSTEEQIIYLSIEEANLKKGTKVRIIGGVFKGVEGTFMRVRGDKRVVVSIPNLFAVATAYLPSQLIEVVENQL